MTVFVDANILIFAADRESPHHERAASWLTAALTGPTHVGIPWESVLAYLRISTHPASSRQPLSHDVAWADVENWLGCANVWIPAATPRHGEVYADLARRYAVAGNLVPDAHLAALAIEHGVALASADSDFARFKELRWIDPIFGPETGG